MSNYCYNLTGCTIVYLVRAEDHHAHLYYKLKSENKNMWYEFAACDDYSCRFIFANPKDVTIFCLKYPDLIFKIKEPV